jgi:hypothetical protein
MQQQQQQQPHTPAASPLKRQGTWACGALVGNSTEEPAASGGGVGKEWRSDAEKPKGGALWARAAQHHGIKKEPAMHGLIRELLAQQNQEDEEETAPAPSTAGLRVADLFGGVF